MKNIFRPVLVLFAALTVMTGVVYPVVVTAVAHAAFASQANGSLIEKNGKPLSPEEEQAEIERLNVFGIDAESAGDGLLRFRNFGFHAEGSGAFRHASDPARPTQFNLSNSTFYGLWSLLALRLDKTEP